MPNYTFYYARFCSFSSFFSLSSSIKYEYVPGLSAQISIIIFPSNSSLKKSNALLLIITYWKRYFIIFIIVRCIKPSFNITHNFFKKIFSYNLNYKAISIRITKFCSIPIIWFNVIIICSIPVILFNVIC